MSGLSLPFHLTIRKSEIPEHQWIKRAMTDIVKTMITAKNENVVKLRGRVRRNEKSSAFQ